MKNKVIQTITNELNEYGGFYTNHNVDVYNDEFLKHACVTTCHYDNNDGDYVPFIYINYDIITLNDYYNFHNDDDIKEFTELYQDYESGCGEYELDNIDGNIDMIVKSGICQDNCRHYVFIRSVNFRLPEEDALDAVTNADFLELIINYVLNPDNLGYFIESIIPNYSDYKIVYQPRSVTEEETIIKYGFKELGNNLYSINRSYSWR